MSHPPPFLRASAPLPVRPPPSAPPSEEEGEARCKQGKERKRGRLSHTCTHSRTHTQARRRRRRRTDAQRKGRALLLLLLPVEATKAGKRGDDLVSTSPVPSPPFLPLTLSPACPSSFSAWERGAPPPPSFPDLLQHFPFASARERLGLSRGREEAPTLTIPPPFPGHLGTYTFALPLVGGCGGGGGGGEAAALLAFDAAVFACWGIEGEGEGGLLCTAGKRRCSIGVHPPLCELLRKKHIRTHTQAHIGGGT